MAAEPASDVQTIQPAVFVNHGGGPMPVIRHQHGPSADSFDSQGAVDALKWLGGLIDQFNPKKLLIVSAHWEGRTPTIVGKPNPDLYFDYGFPNEYGVYDYTYAAKNDEEYVNRIAGLFADAGMEAKVDTERDWDHGVFIPLLIARPQADIDVLQVSLMSSLDAAAHIRLGEILAPLRKEGVMIIGSGYAFHNLRAFFQPRMREEGGPKSIAFDNWLRKVLETNEGMSGEEQRNMLLRWDEENEEEPRFARYCHPREEHLLPLFVCYGSQRGLNDEIGGDVGANAVRANVQSTRDDLGLRASNFLFE